MRIFLTLALVFVSHFAVADLQDGSCTPSQKALVATDHSVALNGQTIQYTATAGFMEVTSADNTAKACVFYTSYEVHTPAGSPPRPLTFAFNGGPGSASLWLHLGLLGPKRVDMGADGLTPPSSLALIDNRFSALDISDVVMIDPVATGFSHTEDQAPPSKFFGVKNDYVSIAEFVRNYLNANNRWDSPKYILGESYGGMRGPLLTNYLQSEMGIGIEGLILVSPALSDVSLEFAPDNNLPFWTFFPSFATTAWYHKKNALQLQTLMVDDVYTAAKDFAFSHLRDALDMGSLLDQTTYESVAKQMSDFIGVDKDVIMQNGLKISAGAYFVDLLSTDKQIIGRYDSRFVGPIIPDGRSDGDFDPSSTGTEYPFTAGINEYLRVDLGWQSASPYNTSGDITEWPDLDGSATDVIPELAQALSQNPRLRVMIVNGYFDLACPMGTAEYEMSQMSVGPDIRARISMKRYFGGHMMYINPAALAQLKTDLTAFVK